MDEVHLSILRILLGILSLVGVLWGAVRYMIKYTVLKQDMKFQEYTNNRVDPVAERANTTSVKVYELRLRTDKIERRVDRLERGKEPPRDN